MLGHLIISEYFLLSLMLSIQYVYERVFLFIPLLSFLPLSVCLSKRVQKYNFFFNPQAFLKKNFFLKAHQNQFLKVRFAFPNPSGLGGQR